MILFWFRIHPFVLLCILSRIFVFVIVINSREDIIYIFFSPVARQLLLLNSKYMYNSDVCNNIIIYDEVMTGYWKNVG